MRSYKSLVYNGTIQNLTKIQVRETSPVTITYIDYRNIVINTQSLSSGSIDIPLSLSPCILDISSSSTYLDYEDTVTLFTNGGSTLYPLMASSTPLPSAKVLQTRIKPCLLKGGQADIESMHLIVRTGSNCKVGVVLTTYNKEGDTEVSTFVFDSVAGRYNFLCTLVNKVACYYKLEYYCNSMVEVIEVMFHYKGVPLL